MLDAKYKREFAHESRADRFQMCACAVAFDADRVTLVYPTAAAGKSVPRHCAGATHPTPDTTRAEARTAPR